MGLIEAIESSGFAAWVRESPSIFAYTSILALHAIGLALIVGINTVVALRLLGFAPGLPIAPLRKLFPWMYVGFTVNALSGVALLAANMSTILGNWMFGLKLGFIALAMVNLELTRAQVFDAPSVSLSGELVLRRARVFAINSLVLWGLAIVSGRLTSYPNFVAGLFGLSP
jgi:hypothetical protein